MSESVDDWRNPYVSGPSHRLWADELVYQSGPARGSRVIVVRNDHLRFEVLPDRGMGIGRLEYRGIPLSWESTVGPIHSDRAEPEGYGWLRTFSGGALVTCGLTQVGDAAVDAGESLGLHGRAANLSAYAVGVQYPVSSGDALAVSGTIRETRVFGEYLELSRVLTTRPGSRTIVLADRVTNGGYESAPFMILYHLNFGYPLVGPEARILIPAVQTRPYDEAAAAYAWDIPSEPCPREPERVYYHEVRVGPGGAVKAGIINPRLNNGLGVAVNWSSVALPRLVQWNMFASGQYTVALEPGNCWTEGRVAERARGTLVMLEPGETWRAELTISVLSGHSELEALRNRVLAE